MDETDAQDRLERMTAASEEPALSEAEIADLLEMCKLADSDGRAPSHASWTPTWDLNRGAAEGWRWKVGKLAGRFDFSTDGQAFHRSQAVAQCERMAEQYRRRIVSNVLLPGALATEA